MKSRLSYLGGMSLVIGVFDNELNEVYNKPKMHSRLGVGWAITHMAAMLLSVPTRSDHSSGHWFERSILMH